MALDSKLAFSALPAALATNLLNAYAEIVTNFAEGRWEPSELNGGKLCEAVYSVIDGYMRGTYPPRAHKPNNMLDACRKLETLYPKASRSPRIQIPRMIVALYEIRNNRGVGHTGGDVDPNQMDATAVLYMGKWLMSELVRLLHGLPTDEAAEIVEALVEREIALVWKWGDKRRVLKTGLTLKQQILLLLSSVNEATETDVVAWLEHKRVGDLRKNVLRPLHAARLIDYDQTTMKLRLLPPGIAEAEALLREHKRPA